MFEIVKILNFDSMIFKMLFLILKRFLNYMNC